MVQQHAGEACRPPTHARNCLSGEGPPADQARAALLKRLGACLAADLRQMA